MAFFKLFLLATLTWTSYVAIHMRKYGQPYTFILMCITSIIIGVLYGIMEFIY